ncbi:unnamed protein product [Brugia pahangi]|uniref:Uncharacterized protein n=1 Tax=Brugia pahangi TaxID=6280 RepID=A0A0N4SYF7_BRUPA|nr:unnamed protein product [Brugia pahangi]
MERAGEFCPGVVAHSAREEECAVRVRTETTRAGQGGSMGTGRCDAVFPSLPSIVGVSSLSLFLCSASNAAAK